jgi:hypothetical protein
MAQRWQRAHDADSGAYPRSQVTQMYSSSCAEANAASGTHSASQPCFTRRRVLGRPTCRTAAAPIVCRNSLRARRGIRKIALRHNAVCIEACLLRPSGRWLHPYGADLIPCCLRKCRTSSRSLTGSPRCHHRRARFAGGASGCGSGGAEIDRGSRVCTPSSEPKAHEVVRVRARNCQIEVETLQVQLHS